MLRKFNISIDGKEYYVEMEEIGGSVGQPVQQEVSPVPTPPSPVEKEEPVLAQPNPVKEDVEAMGAPMPGTILKVLVEVGEKVKQNQPLLVLEAMKMENEIVASHDGTISAIHVTQGEMVDVGVPLVTVNK